MSGLTRKEPLDEGLMIKVVCDCPKPVLWAMREVKRTSGWGPFKKHHTEKVKFWQSKEDVRWTCPKCNSMWNYSAFRGEQYSKHRFYVDSDPWYVSDEHDHRTSWKKVSADSLTTPV